MTNIVTTNLPVVSDSNVDAYISYVNSFPLLTEQEEKDYAKRWYNDGDVDAAKQLVLSHLRLVVSISRNYLGYGLPFADLIQEGSIGLMKAVKKFDPNRQVRLVTFAMYWIKAEINDFIIKNWRIVKTVTTKAQRKLFFNLRSQRSDVGNLSDAEARKIAQNLGVGKSDVVEMNMRMSGRDVALVGDNEDDNSPIEWLSNETQTPEHILEKKAEDYIQTTGLEGALSELDERSRRIIESRWLVDAEEQLTLHDLAAEFGISAERVRQIESKALQKMKVHLAEIMK